MYQQIIGADIGRCEVKLYSNGDVVRFPARVGEWQQREISSGGNYEVEIDGEKWFVGELALLNRISTGAWWNKIKPIRRC
jgi:hypothetical protein